MRYTGFSLLGRKIFRIDIFPVLEHLEMKMRFADTFGVRCFTDGTDDKPGIHAVTLRNAEIGSKIAIPCQIAVLVVDEDRDSPQRIVGHGSYLAVFRSKYICPHLSGDIRAVVGENNTDLKISVMADVGRCDYKSDIIPKSDSVIDTVRIATYVGAIPTCIDMIEDAKNKGYETSANIMAVSKVNGDDLKNALELLGQSDVDIIYLVDSFGSFYPEQIRRLTEQYMEICTKYGKKMGIHAHNNQQLAFANTLEAMNRGDGATYLDATVNGLGRGAGNCHLEMLLGFLRNPKYKTIPMLRFIENYILPLREQGLVWGYDVPYLLTGQLNAHPSFAIKFIKEHRQDYYNFFHELIDDTL